MTPKKVTNAEAATEPGSGSETTTSMNPDDLQFLIACIANPAGGSALAIDCKAVAEARGFKHPGSVANRIAKLKKQYNLNIAATNASPGRKASDAAGPSEPKVATTPSKNRVRKTRGVAKKVSKPKKEASVSDEETELSEEGRVKFNGDGEDVVIEDAPEEDSEELPEPELLVVAEGLEVDEV